MSRLDHWSELELLACSIGSVLSQKAFNVTGGFVRDSLAPNTVDQLTLIKMIQFWISNDYKTPKAVLMNTFPCISSYCQPCWPTNLLSQLLLVFHLLVFHYYQLRQPLWPYFGAPAL